MISGLHSWRVTTDIKDKNRYLRFAILSTSLLAIRQISIHTDGLTNGPVLCPIRILTGYPCPACGTTRSIGAITEGRFSDALSLNPLGYLTLFALFLWALNSTRIKAFNRRFNERFLQIATSQKVALIFSTYAIAWIFNIFRVNSATF